jgi:hypothetical protein
MYNYMQHACEAQLSPEQRRRFRFVREMTLGFHDVNIALENKLHRFPTSSEAGLFFALHPEAGLSLFDFNETPWFLVEVATRHESQMMSRLLTSEGFWFPIRLETQEGFALLFRFNYNFGAASFCSACELALEGLSDRFESIRHGVHDSNHFIHVRDVLRIPPMIDVNSHDLLERLASRFTGVA